MRLLILIVVLISSFVTSQNHCGVKMGTEILSKDISPVGKIRIEEGVIINYFFKCEQVLKASGDLSAALKMEMKYSFYGEQNKGSMNSVFNTHKWLMGAKFSWKVGKNGVDKVQLEAFYERKTSPNATFPDSERLGIKFYIKDSFFGDSYTLNPYLFIRQEVNLSQKVRLLTGLKAQKKFQYASVSLPMYVGFADLFKTKRTGVLAFGFQAEIPLDFLGEEDEFWQFMSFKIKGMGYQRFLHGLDEEAMNWSFSAGVWLKI